MSAFSRSLLTLACASSMAALVGCAAEETAPVAADAPAVESAADVSTTQAEPESDAQPQPSTEAAGPNPTLPAGYRPGAADSGPKPSHAQDAAKDGAGNSAASGIEKCVYRKDRVRGEGNPADVPSTVSGTVYKAEAGDLDGGEPGIVLPEYASEEVWVLALDAPTTLSGFKSGSPKRETITYAGKECIGLLEKGAWAGYEGKHVTLPFEPDRGWWQSDVSVPMGGLRVDYTPDEVQ
ncbi:MULTISPECIES: hypothetical protein [unclassified Corynebacterium]|uniref:hypothetical protein n=1 Tax=unclassified Corynebacterium TaxID=2624378 RepID=UPI0008A3E6A5|nr:MULTISPECIES: hypothetical protein [unclassified Corynebacterium]OFN76623.1 hypothetical protein HMPREF2537_08535 [Corynebacterium sp. HMSC074E01]OFP63388.1 hypothetical protein HMPREF2978_11365 [Corynebacterium sp. HMSC074C01]